MTEEKRIEHLRAALLRHDDDAFRALIDLDFDFVIPAETPPLHLAAWLGETALVEQAVDRGESPNKVHDGITPLGLAAHFGDLSTTVSLLARGADPNRISGPIYPSWHARRGCNGASARSPLLLASGADSPTDEERLSVVTALLDAGADPRAITREGWTPLHLATCRGAARTVRRLIAAGVPVDSLTATGATALAFAAARGFTEIMRLLIAATADVNACGRLEFAPLSEARRRKRTAAEAMLIAAGARMPGAAMRSITLRDPDAPAFPSLNYDLPRSSVIGSGGIWRGLEYSSDTDLHAAIFCADEPAVRRLAQSPGALAATDRLGRTPLMAAARYAPDMAKILIDLGADVNARSAADPWARDGWSPLVCAIQADHADLVRLLIARGADIDLPYSPTRHITPLMVAAAANRVEIAELLMDLGARLTSLDPHGDTPLHTAAFFGHVEMVRMLADRGIDVNAVNGRGSNPLRKSLSSAHSAWHWSLTPAQAQRRRDRFLEIMRICLERGGAADEEILIQAVHTGETVLVRMLLDSGVDPAVTDHMGESALAHAAGAGYVDIVAMLREALEKRPAASESWLSDAIRAAIEEDREPVLAALLGDTVPDAEMLLLASENCRWEIVRLLLSRGADPNAADGEGNTPVLAAIRAGLLPDEEPDRAATLQALIASGARIETANEFGETPLFAAIFGAVDGGVETVSLLLEAGAQIDAVHAASGLTPLMAACEVGNEDMVRLLIESDADVNAVSDLGDMAWNIARRHGHDEVARLLEMSGAAEPDGLIRDLWSAVLWNRTAEAIAFIARGSDLEKRNADGLTPMMAAVAWWGNREIVEALLEAGAPADTRSSDYGDTALDMAVIHGRHEIVRLLLEHRGNAAMTDDYHVLLHFLDPQHWNITQTETEAQTEVVRLLLASGVDVNVRSRDTGTTPLHQAAMGDRPRILKMLLDAGADVNAREFDSHFAGGATALSYAVRQGTSRAVALLLEHGAAPNLADSYGNTPLMYAVLTAASGRARSLEEVSRAITALLRHGADPNLGDSQGDTPLMRLIRGAGTVDDATMARLTRILLQGGASLDLRSSSGMSARELAHRHAPGLLAALKSAP